MKANEQLVSVIVPTYNCAAYIGEAVQSVLSQTHKKLEVLIVDNYSSDETETVVQGFSDPRVRYFKFRNNGIIAASRNLGVQQSQGEVLAFLDADDLWLPEKLQVQLPLLHHSYLSIVAADYFPLGTVSLYRRDPRLGGMAFRDYSYSETLVANPVMTSSVVMRREDFVRSGGFSESSDYQFIEDWELWLRVVQNGGAVRVLGSPLFGYRIRRNKNRDCRQLSLRALALVQKHVDSGFVSKGVARAAEGNCLVQIGKACLDTNDRRGIRYYYRALRLGGNRRIRARAIGGLSLFLLPFAMRCWTIDAIYRFHWSLVSHKFRSVTEQPIDNS